MTEDQITVANAALRANWAEKQAIINHYKATGRLPLMFRIRQFFSDISFGGK